ncbi:hypothetical protein CcaverHIS002_0700120 [Cutaneotrichosporon cavernicola]|uniref:Uncharacterized protein n=1 Tax=Cutaneotrichosporon cavernicola TaxID=279322 RepID=A0AA48QYM3_9TREE|nr:uncharacterized protein CcaverHIS019_0700120 [Cutaneotrichosporon cavernicola]BEI86666.1 hypothetical protein CcaverHIS002_0700120 [Cutaneotrichosporon cavernicola]BEI94440.1 hypothetical protein CcaverHIS019_0700120 [Cutaneotrichosporon cavernicola]BEJ02217.1 hypothetical protein CcaverHIS631_0700120 [Cutaneotrichosporon cavernicola]BEJ09977.1 hypothetical protein CcaverHIS641_0700120 [Cutaneotrichosporon cavernicola]
MSTGKHLYRSVLRELRLSSNAPRATRNPDVGTQIRKLIEGGEPKAVERAMVETRDFLRANRTYGELLKRYNPTHGMTQEERVKATARRVGLNSPVEYKEK